MDIKPPAGHGWDCHRDDILGAGDEALTRLLNSGISGVS